ncbi:MAG TPA: hypothetical protein VJ276_23455, partial [Thermoanaerobaculia bacterium]|nr:hypothetical protein [Thermoanaerobaculia bacterium]
TGYLLAQPAGHIVMTPDGKLVQKGGTPAPTPPAVLTLGPDEGALSLRVEGEYQGRIVGTLLVKRNGKWSEVILGGGNTFVKNR